MATPPLVRRSRTGKGAQQRRQDKFRTYMNQFFQRGLDTAYENLKKSADLDRFDTEYFLASHGQPPTQILDNVGFEYHNSEIMVMVDKKISKNLEKFPEFDIETIQMITAKYGGSEVWYCQLDPVTWNDARIQERSPIEVDRSTEVVPCKSPSYDIESPVYEETLSDSEEDIPLSQRSPVTVPVPPEVPEICQPFVTTHPAWTSVGIVTTDLDLPVPGVEILRPSTRLVKRGKVYLVRERSGIDRLSKACLPMIAIIPPQSLGEYRVGARKWSELFRYVRSCGVKSFYSVNRLKCDVAVCREYTCTSEHCKRLVVERDKRSEFPSFASRS